MASIKTDMVAQLDKGLARLRAQLAERLVAGEEIDRLASSLETIAKREGQLHAALRIRQAMEFTQAKEPLTESLSGAGMKEAVRILTTPKTDTYSGRSNDLVRAFNDGANEVAGEAARWGDFGKFMHPDA